jgi:hypothetical protein
MEVCKYCEQARGEFAKTNHATLDGACFLCNTNFIEDLFGDKHGDECPCHACKAYHHEEEIDYWLDVDHHVPSNFWWRIAEVWEMLDNPPQENPNQLSMFDGESPA